MVWTCHTEPTTCTVEASTITNILAQHSQYSYSIVYLEQIDLEITLAIL